MNDLVQTEIVGTYREDIEVGRIYLNTPFESYGNKSIITCKILRESNEEEYRKRYNYHGPFPFNPFNKSVKFFEVVALD